MPDNVGFLRTRLEHPVVKDRPDDMMQMELHPCLAVRHGSLFLLRCFFFTRL